MRPAIIIDIDECFLDSRCIAKYLPKGKGTRKEWDDFHEHISECVPNKSIVDLLGGLSYHYDFIFITSREARKNQIKETINALESIIEGGRSYYLFMRPEHDYRPAHIVKRDLYTSCVKDRFDVKLAIDDDPKNIKMFKKLGIDTLKFDYGKKGKNNE